MVSPLSNENNRWMVEIITVVSLGTLDDLRRFTVNIVLNGSPVSVRRYIPNSFSACFPRLLRSTRKSTRFMGVYDKDRDQVYESFFSSTAPAPMRLQTLSTYVTGNLGLFSHLLLGPETNDYRFQSQWEMASGVGATGFSFIKFKPIDRPDQLDENSEYYYAKMIPLITMQEMYYILSENGQTDMDKFNWYNKARMRRGLPDIEAMGMGPTFAMYWGYGYGGYFFDQEVRRETWGLGQYFFYAKHNQFYGEYGSYTPLGSGSGRTDAINVQPPLPTAEMK